MKIKCFIHAEILHRFPARVSALPCRAASRYRSPHVSDDTQALKPTLRAIAREIARQQFDGLNVSEATIADLESAARGEIDTDEVTRRIYQRLGTQPPPVFQ